MFAFVCAKEDTFMDDEPHETVGVMVICPTCGRNAVGGYICNTCEHEDVSPPDQLAGHGAGKCGEVSSTSGEIQ